MGPPLSKNNEFCPTKPPLFAVFLERPSIICDCAHRQDKLDSMGTIPLAPAIQLPCAEGCTGRDEKTIMRRHQQYCAPLSPIGSKVVRASFEEHLSAQEQARIMSALDHPPWQPVSAESPSYVCISLTFWDTWYCETSLHMSNHMQTIPSLQRAEQDFLTQFEWKILLYPYNMLGSCLLERLQRYIQR